MPVIRVADLLDPRLREQLVTTLAAELQSEAGSNSGAEPVVYENPISPTARFIAIVVWSRWGAVPWGARTGLILEAYQRADAAQPHSSPRAPHLATASGLTWDEADDNGLFKFKIEPLTREGELDPAAVRKAMIDAGAYETSGELRLRFLTLDSAKTAFARLQNALPHAHWSIAAMIRNQE